MQWGGSTTTPHAFFCKSKFSDEKILERHLYFPETTLSISKKLFSVQSIFTTIFMLIYEVTFL